MSPLLRRPTFEWFAVTVMCMVVVVLAALEGWLWRIDQSIYDSTLSAFMRPPSSDVVIIAIDDASLASLGRWPWSRRTHAALVDRAREAGARAMMMDLILDTPSRDDPEADQLLAEAMRRYGQVVLPVVQATTGAALMARPARCRSLPRRPRPLATITSSSTPTAWRAACICGRALAPPGIRSWPSPC